VLLNRSKRFAWCFRQSPATIVEVDVYVNCG
jgi:hypothetical protein